MNVPACPTCAKVAIAEYVIPTDYLNSFISVQLSFPHVGTPYELHAAMYDVQQPQYVVYLPFEIRLFGYCKHVSALRFVSLTEQRACQRPSNRIIQESTCVRHLRHHVMDGLVVSPKQGSSRTSTILPYSGREYTLLPYMRPYNRHQASQHLQSGIYRSEVLLGPLQEKQAKQFAVRCRKTS